ncbi:MAG: PAS domain-containing protein [Haloferacaceae archaeon]
MTEAGSREVWDALPEGVAVVDPETGELVDVNDRLCELVGRERAALVGSSVSTFDAPESVPDAATVADRVVRLSAGARDRFDCDLQVAGDERLPVEVRLRRGELDGDERVLATVAPTAERREYERELERYRRRLEGAMLAGGVAWWEMDVETGETLFHENKTDMLGYSPDGFETYEDFVALLHPDDYDPAMEAMRDHLEGRAARYDVEYRIETASGEYHWFHDVGGITERDDEGRPRKVTGIVVDVTRRKETEEKLRRTNEQLAMVNRIVRHDIRNDMTVALGWLDILRDHVPDDRQGVVDSVVESCEHTVELTGSVRDLLELVEGGDAGVEPVALRPVIESEVERVRRSYGHATVTAGDLPDVRVEANGMLSSVVGNLLNNAVQHSDSDRPEAHVDVEDCGETVVASVADDGPGVPDVRKGEIFARGEKGIESEGTGLGLYLVSTLVDAYGGDVWVEDGDPRGAVFRVELRKASP